MSLFSKKEKAPQEPQYFRSATNMKTYNYKVYYMNKSEKILYFILAFIAGAAVAYLFYGGIGKEPDGSYSAKTWILNIAVCVLVGLITAKIYLPIRTQQLQKKKQNELRFQFRELLDALATSIGSGKNIPESFRSAREDLGVIYPEDAPIIKELRIIQEGINNNVDIEASLLDFGNRSGIEDIVSFANVFETCYRKGGNMRDVIRNTQQIISEKMEIEQEIQTMVAGNKNDQLIMAFMPIVLVGMIKLMSPEFAANFSTTSGVLSTTVAIGIFIAAYFIGKKILDIKF